MKQYVALLLVALAVAASAQYPYGAYGDPYGIPTPYSYGYESPSIGGAHSHQETGDGAGRVQGSYTIQDADGRHRTVTYVADETGYHPTIETNELGTETSAPANAEVHSAAPTGPQAAASYGY